MLVRNMVFEASSRMLTIVLGLAFVPVSIRYLGLSGFGAWESITALANLGVILYAPVASCILWRVASAEAHLRKSTARRMACQGALYCLVASLLYAWLIHSFGENIAVWLRFPGARSEGVLPNRLLIGAACLAQGLLGCSECIGFALGGLGRLRYATMARTGALLVNYIVGVVCLSLGMGLESLMLGLVAMGLVGSATNGLVLWRVSEGSLGSGASLFTVSSVRYASTLVVGFLAGIGKDSADRIIAAATASTAFTATLGLANRMTVMLGEVNRYAYTPLIPAIAAAQAAGDEARVRMLFERCMAYNAFASGCLTAVLIAGSETILRLWTGVVPESTHTITVTVAAGVVLQLMLTGPATAVLRGLGNVKYETLYVALGLVLNLCLSLVLVPLQAAQGKILATSIALGVASLLFVGVVLRARCLASSPFLSNLLLYALAMGTGLLCREAWSAMDLSGFGMPAGPGVVVLLSLPGMIFAVLAITLSPATRRQLVWLWARIVPSQAG